MDSIAYMIDYLCLKLGWTTDQVLDNAHFDNERKLNFYQALDNVDATRPMAVIPLGFDKKTNESSRKAHSKSLSGLKKLVHGSPEASVEEQKDELDKLFGEEGQMNDLMQKLMDGTIPMKKMGGM